MLKLIAKRLLIMSSALLLTGCVGAFWTGASLIYDRHHFYKKMDDFQLVASARQILYKDTLFKQPGCLLDVAALNGDLLLAGHLPSKILREIAQQRLVKVGGYRRFFNQVKVSNRPVNQLKDSWISAKIRGQILQDSSIDPTAFKIITVDRIVYIMGEVRPVQGKKIVTIARSTKGVSQVVTLLRYYTINEADY